MEINWQLYPYPHCIIDNFLADDEFASLRSSLRRQQEISVKYQASFDTDLEKKQISDVKSLQVFIRNFIDFMASAELKIIFSNFVGLDPSQITSLGATQDFSGYSPYHITQESGMLGSHVDHSHVSRGQLVHVANAIFYASEDWQPGWGGETILFSDYGLNPLVSVAPVPNRMLLFIHSQSSFHGVSRYKSPKGLNRETFYHDYYIDRSLLPSFVASIKNEHDFKLAYSTHGTTFVPAMPFGVESFRFSSFFKARTYLYLIVYAKYLLGRLIQLI